jgi:hypothetical protein
VIFLIVGAVAVVLGTNLIIFRNAAAVHAERQMTRAVSSSFRPSYAPWFIVIIGIGMIALGSYFIVASLFRLLS